MKRFILFFAAVLMLVLSSCNQQKPASLNLPESDKIVGVNYIAGNRYKSITDRKNIDNLLSQLFTINTKSFDSYQDTPMVDEYSEISFELLTGTSGYNLFLYKEDDDFFAEQPYNGIFVLDEAQYQSIVAVFND